MKTLFFIIMFLSVTTSADVSKITLSLGEIKTLPLAGSGSVWIENSQVLSASATAGSVQIKGQREGTSAVRVGPVVYKVQVLHPSKLAIQTSFEKEVSSIVGLKLVTEDGDLFVDGKLYRWADWQRLHRLAKKYGTTFQFKATMSDDLQNRSTQEFKALLKKAKLPPQTLIFEPTLEARITTSDLYFKKYQNILSSYGINVIRDDQSLELAPTIKVQITVAEIKRDLSIKYGLRWPDSVSSSKIYMMGDTEMSELAFNARALENQGLGKVLASPNIICRSGKEAEFVAGGEFPIQVMNFKMANVIWKKYGIILKVKPKADTSGRMSISIETEVSTIDESRKVGDIPGLLTNHVSSHFDLSKPQTIALSGLIKNEDSNSHEGVPFLSRVPVLGPLFSSKDFRENRSELVIFVRPSIIEEDSQDEGSRPQHISDIEERP